MKRSQSDLTSNFQATRRAPMYPLSVAAPDSSLRLPNPSRPIGTKPDSQQKGKTDAFPVEFADVNLPIQLKDKEASSDFVVPIHKTNQVGIMPTTVEPARRLSPGMAKTKSKSSSVETMVSVSHQGHGQSTQKGVSIQEQKVKPNPEKVPVPKTFGGPRDAPRKDQGREVKEKGEDINDQASNFIKGAKDRIRIMINAGGTKGVGQKDSGTDRFGKYIQQAKIRIRSMSGIGGDKNVQSK